MSKSKLILEAYQGNSINERTSNSSIYEDDKYYIGVLNSKTITISDESFIDYFSAYKNRPHSNINVFKCAVERNKVTFTLVRE